MAGHYFERKRREYESERARDSVLRRLGFDSEQREREHRDEEVEGEHIDEIVAGPTRAEARNHKLGAFPLALQVGVEDISG